jgi:hypothetical protein
MATLEDMTRQLQQTPKEKHEGFVDKFLDTLKAGGDYRKTITLDGVEVPLIFYFAYHVNWYEGEVSSQIVEALLPKYTLIELKDILRKDPKNDLVEQTMYFRVNRNLFQVYKDVGLAYGLVEPESEDEEEYY